VGDWSGEWCFARMVFYNKGDSMKSLHAIWVYEVFNEVTEAFEPAHAECWECETPGPQYGTKVGYLPGWTEEDCK
tara:strand:+ start:680 stop:904 length:225 start_codon:yes stop_codon:yes gene_type:complete